jgi:glycosyltransferase involved in cell wall biosynthesis
VIPCLNEERFIGSVVLKTRKYVDLVIVVDDGSVDSTAEIAQAAGAIVLRHEVNRGKGAALNTAFGKIKEIGAVRALVLLDGDGQHEPAAIPELLKPILDGNADAVVGSRLLSRSNRIPFYRRTGQRILSVVTNVGSKTKLTDSQSGFRAFSPKALEVLKFGQEGFGVESEMQFLIQSNNLKTTEVPILVNYDEKAKRNPVRHGVGVLANVLHLVSQSRPLLFFGVPGAVVLMGGIAAGVIVAKSVANGRISIGWAMVSILLCIVGLLSIFTGIQLNSISSLLAQQNRKE